MIAHVDANNFYASVEQAFNPALRGRPVVVLSNNDGVIVARSAEARALGIEMAMPYFEARPMLERHRVRVLSSNYALYDDMANRLNDIYRSVSERVEEYSIDESFLDASHVPGPYLEAWARDLRATVQRWLGLSVGIGVAPTKTLAKLANHQAKRAPGCTGVCVLADEEPTAYALAAVELEDLWGIARGFRRRLEALDIRTPLELRAADPHRVRAALGVVGQRMVHELRGEPCMELETERADRQNICCSRSFGQETARLEDLREAVSTFIGLATVKLRRQSLAAEAVTTFVGTNIHAPPHVEQYHRSYGVALPVATDDTRELAQAAAWCLDRVYRSQHSYKRAGIMLHRLCRRDAVQPSLFDAVNRPRTHRLMQVMDAINTEHGRGAVRLASASPTSIEPGRTVSWHGRAQRRSPRYTTRWDELPTARARA